MVFTALHLDLSYSLNYHEMQKDYLINAQAETNEKHHSKMSILHLIYSTQHGNNQQE